MLRILKIIIGINFISYSLIFFIMYLNLFNIGYDFLDYLKEIITHIESLLFIPGIYLLWETIFKNNNNLTSSK
ncbi:MAG: hypothetical protein GX265_01000 [Mollicutes bacterium]|nr:hypothetical protein [Mollicutes bacterium]